MDKPRVVFTFVEAGMGHIMPLNSIYDAFLERYGHCTEVVRSGFFSETGNKDMIAFEQMMEGEVIKHNKDPHYGFFSNRIMDFFGTRASSWGAMRVRWPKCYHAAVAHMRDLRPDMVVSTHWASNYYARRTFGNKILTVMYCPDVRINTLFRYPCDLTLTAFKSGYDYSLRRYKHRYNQANLALVSYPIRRQAFEVEPDPRELRRRIGLDPDRFTVVLAEGGYGIGKMQAICERLVALDVPLNIVAVCGKNTELYTHFKSLPVHPSIHFLPLGFCNNMLEVLAAANLFLGKSGNMLAELCFFQVPQIITHYATPIEKHIGENYLHHVGSALKIFDPDEAVAQICEFAAHPERMEGYIRNMQGFRAHCGGGPVADTIFQALVQKYPHLSDFAPSPADQSPILTDGI